MIVENRIAAQATIKDARAGRLKTYNVKEVASIIGKSQVSTIDRAKRLGFTKFENGWRFSAEQIDLIRTLGRTKKTRLRVNKQYMMAALVSLKESQLKHVMRKTGLRLNDYDLLIKACNLYKTREFSWYGILKRLGI
jgi:hypothetical protein